MSMVSSISEIPKQSNGISSSNVILGSSVNDGHIDWSYGMNKDVLDTIECVEERLELVEQKVECLPALIVDAIEESVTEMFPEYTYSYDDILYTDMRPLVTDNEGNEVKDQYGGAVNSNLKVDAKEVLVAFSKRLVTNLRSNINYDEIKILRDRVQQLEEDLGYREAVAGRLMEE